MSTLVRFSIAVVAASLLSTVAMAQDLETKFRLAQDPKNIQGCTNYDAALTRVHTFTIKDGQATVKSAGGIDDKMKMVKPNVYQTVFDLGGTKLDVVADLSATPKSMTVTEKNRGCRWHGTPE